MTLNASDSNKGLISRYLAP